MVVARFAREVVQPRVRDMDEAEVMDKEIINSMFENGVSFYIFVFFFEILFTCIIDLT